MGCEAYREALSARADGEAVGLDDRLLDAHLAACPACRAFADQLGRVSQRGRVTIAPAMPDLSRRVTRRTAAQDRQAHSILLRLLLAVVAVEVLVLSVIDLAGDGGATAAHSTRHLGAFTAAYGVGLLAVAVRPARARAMLPVAVVVTGALVVTAVVDVMQGRIPLAGEALHLPEVVSVLVIWAMARAPRSAGAGSGRPTAPVVEAVPDPPRPAPGPRSAEH